MAWRSQTSTARVPTGLQTSSASEHSRSCTTSATSTRGSGCFARCGRRSVKTSTRWSTTRRARRFAPSGRSTSTSGTTSSRRTSAGRTWLPRGRRPHARPWRRPDRQPHERRGAGEPRRHRSPLRDVESGDHRADAARGDRARAARSDRQRRRTGRHRRADGRLRRARADRGDARRRFPWAASAARKRWPRS